MKKRLLVLMLALSIPFAMTACSNKEEAKNDQSEMVEATTTAPETSEEMEGATEETVVLTEEEMIKECLQLLGKNDEEAATVWDGGEQNYTEDGEILIGRNYKVTLFGEETMISTSYSEAGVANTLTADLKGLEAAAYQEKLTQIFGEAKEKTDTPSESGAIYTMWESEGKQIYLYELEDLVTLQMTMPD